MRKAANLDSDLHGVIVLLLDFAKAYDTLQRPYLLSALTWLECHSTSYLSWQHYTATPHAVFLVNEYRLSRRAVTCGIRKGAPLRQFSLFSPSIMSIRCFKRGRTFEVYLSNLAGGLLSSKARGMLMILLYTFAIGLQFFLLSLFSMTSPVCQVFVQIRLN